jgi:hypothetical protein
VATIELPTTNTASVREGGKNAAASPDIKSIQSVNGNAQFLVGSGNYSFTCPVP